MQTRNPFFDDLAKMTTDGLAFAHGINQEMQNFMRTQAEKAGQVMGFVSQDEFQALMTLCEKQAEGLKSLTDLCGMLQQRLDNLEGHVFSGEESTPTPPSGSEKDHGETGEEEESFVHR